jgi:SsrA-binding protein
LGLKLGLRVEFCYNVAPFRPAASWQWNGAISFCANFVRELAESMADDVKVVATNRKAYHDYFIQETYEAGIALTGTEIKSVRNGAVNLRDSYAQVRDGEMWLQNVHISPYEAGNRFNVDPYRARKLLLHRKEINRLMGRVLEKGLTIVPLRMYLKNHRAKVELALVKGKRQYDKREAISKRDAAREMQRAYKQGQEES